MDILVVEDEPNLNEAICHILGEVGWSTESAFDGRQGLDMGLAKPYDTIMVDVMLPELDGFSVVRELRAKGVESPIIMVTAKSSTADKIEGLDCGADDYMTKPIDTDELLARIRALMRRNGKAPTEEVTFADLTLDTASHDLCCRDRSVHLSQKEFDLMRVLMSTPGVVSKQDLLRGVWSDNADISENSVEAYVSFLRKKLSFLDSHCTITTLRMIGYRLEEL